MLLSYPLLSRSKMELDAMLLVGRASDPGMLLVYYRAKGYQQTIFVVMI